MAEYGEWNRKGATLSDVTATKEYGVSRAFIVRGIRAGKLEYREGAIWGNPYLRVLRNQLEQYIERPVAESRDLDENTLLDVDADGNICSITVEHASQRAGIPELSYEEVTT